MFWKSFYIKSRKAALYSKDRTLYITFKNGNNVTDLSAPLLTRGGKDVAMTYIAQHSLIPTFNWQLIDFRERVLRIWNGHSIESLLPLPESLYLIFCFLSLNFIPREHEITLIIVRTLEIMKMYSLQNTASPHLNWSDRVAFHLLRVQCQNMEAFRVLVLTPKLHIRIPQEAAPQTIYITDSGWDSHMGPL